MTQEIDLNYVQGLLEKQAAQLAEQNILSLKEKYEANLDLLEQRALRAEQRDRMTRNMLKQLGLADKVAAHATEEQIFEARQRTTRLVEMGMHLEIILKANAENETVRAAWEKFMLTLRMCGYDGK